jgi:hypothetical protein
MAIRWSHESKLGSLGWITTASADDEVGSSNNNARIGSREARARASIGRPSTLDMVLPPTWVSLFCYQLSALSTQLSALSFSFAADKRQNKLLFASLVRPIKAGRAKQE